MWKLIFLLCNANGYLLLRVLLGIFTLILKHFFSSSLWAAPCCCSQYFYFECVWKKYRGEKKKQLSMIVHGNRNECAHQLSATFNSLKCFEQTLGGANKSLRKWVKGVEKRFQGFTSMTLRFFHHLSKAGNAKTNFTAITNIIPRVGAANLMKNILASTPNEQV